MLRISIITFKHDHPKNKLINCKRTKTHIFFKRDFFSLFFLGYSFIVTVPGGYV